MSRPEGYGGGLFDRHAAMLADSCVPPGLAHQRGYVSVDTATRLGAVGITKSGRRVPGLLIPLRRKDGSVWGHQYRPDSPRTTGAGRTVKYETPTGQRNGIDVPPGVGPLLDDPAVPLWVTEGTKKADAAAALGLACVALPGVWSWRGRNDHGGKTAIPDWHDVALDGRRVVLAFDSDVMVKPAVRAALDQLAGYLGTKGATVEFAHLPDTGDGKTGLDDHIATGADADALYALVRPQPPEPLQDTIPEAEPTQRPPTDPPRPAPGKRTRGDVMSLFRKHFGPRYDLQYLDVVLSATAAGLHLTGDPAWLLIVGGAGVGKTETLAATEAAGCVVVSTVKTEAALLSGTPANETAKDATGGLLRQLGDDGVLVLKDFTTILSLRREDRATILAALREVYDGVWVRVLGSEGGRTLTWRGRVTLLGGVTGVYDEHHGVIAAMGDRFLLLRVDSEDDDVRRHATRQAMLNAGGEAAMRAELGDVVAGFLRSLDPTPPNPPDDLLDELVDVADVIARARSQVAADFKGEPDWAHAPEMPTRVAKQLVTLWRGARLTGLSDRAAWALVRRVAHDTIPPGRRLCLLDVHDHPGSSTADVARRVGMSRRVVDRRLQELALHRLVEHRSDPGSSLWRWWPVDGRLGVVDLLRTGYGQTEPDGCAETSPLPPMADTDTAEPPFLTPKTPLPNVSAQVDESEPGLRLGSDWSTADPDSVAAGMDGW